MRKLSWVLALVAMLVAGPNATSFADDGFKSVDFPTAGGIQGRADVYAGQSKSATLVLLFHQAGWSRGEYREIAPKLIKAGYQVMAVDQRSGGKVNGIQNETH
ncbi:MAG: alpha/beta hydrolase, partial [Deltaproteobacteria bacterium]|nr:alpha/beta hydrolase [Deltaproteobacteria bacterium]